MRSERKKRLLRLLAAPLLAVSLLASPPGSALALDDDEFGGYASDTLSVQVGYPGGPYYEKHLFTLSELAGMDVVCADYTFIDNMPSVVIDHVKGVRLADIIDAAGIDLGAVQTFHFWIQDKKESSYTSFSKAILIDTPRYCYYSLPDNFNYDEGEGNEYATADAQPVDTVMALADDWNRCIAGATFGSDYLNLNANTRFRLIFGQRDAVTRTAVNSAKWVYAVVAEVTEAPAVMLDRSELRLSPGGTARLSASVTAADPLIAKMEPVVWSTDNQQVATVDETGSVTARTRGTAVITAEFHGTTASAAVTVTAAAPKTSADGSNAKGTGGVAAAGTGEQPVSGGASAPDGTGEEPPSAQTLNPDAPKESADPDGSTPQVDSSSETPVNSGGSEEKEAPPLLWAIGVAAISLFAGSALIARLISRIRERRAGKPKE